MDGKFYSKHNRLPTNPIVGVGDVAIFILEHGGKYYEQFDLNKIKEIVELHQKYGTLFVLRKQKTNEVLAVARWNWVDKEMTIASVLDVIVHKDWRSPRILKFMLLKCVQQYPQGKYIVFERLGKYPDREKRMYNIREFLRRKTK